ncbi:cyclic lactone autoinducer peptide [Listeria valentina]|uniref:cyclic lactone autoinducer peptide n=1 Tax=Listeria valentina TaxID=2705293 RepID=UPI00142F7E41|nr:cyclic lactone autoinducer peptide [Listeria valentina]
MKFMNDKVMQFLGKKLEDEALKIANTSMKKSCVGVTYEPKNPLVNKLEIKNK